MADLVQLAQIRAQGDSKLLKKAIKDLYKLASGIQGDELLAAHETFLTSLAGLSQQLSKTTRLRQITNQEVEGYHAQASEIEATQAETSQKLLLLKVQLEEAQADRIKKIEYDKRAKEINKLPDRAKGQETINKLNEDIAALKAEEETYVQTWRTRRTEFDAIVGALTTMGDAIKEEKMEQERRRALDEDDAAAEDDAGSPDAPNPDGHPHHALDPAAKPFTPGTHPTANGEGGAEEGGMEVELEEGEEGEGDESREEGEMKVDE